MSNPAMMMAMMQGKMDPMQMMLMNQMGSGGGDMNPMLLMSMMGGHGHKKGGIHPLLLAQLLKKKCVDITGCVQGNNEDNIPCGNGPTTYRLNGVGEDIEISPCCECTTT